MPLTSSPRGFNRRSPPIVTSCATTPALPSPASGFQSRQESGSARVANACRMVAYGNPAGETRHLASMCEVKKPRARVSNVKPFRICP